MRVEFADNSLPEQVFAICSVWSASIPKSHDWMLDCLDVGPKAAVTIWDALVARLALRTVLRAPGFLRKLDTGRGHIEAYDGEGGNN